jgi:hypothetical protein
VLQYHTKLISDCRHLLLQSALGNWRRRLRLETGCVMIFSIAASRTMTSPMLSTPKSQAEGPQWPVARMEAIHSSLGAFWGFLPCPTLNFPSMVVVVLANNTMHFVVVPFSAYVYLVLVSPLEVQIFPVPHKAAMVHFGKTRGVGV